MQAETMSGKLPLPVPNCPKKVPTAGCGWLRFWPEPRRLSLEAPFLLRCSVGDIGSVLLIACRPRRSLSKQEVGWPLLIGGLNMARINTHSVSEYTDFVIDEIVARCGDDMHSAVKALLLINEHLEAE